ncbi:hypothetical protein K431DRAFT_288043 [Polychaeton citri CBS 116435]|uniref:WW domain-containing protein n=1 Tax=Polychaeton citri CBS 116435 TaxID=1314669 RepID=A0A9P4Q1X0_9PEZI|nr:hypothetical protein K431DRAFT_288043 [Polychaeton citri CBS 116435]
MESPNKRLKPSPLDLSTQADYIPLSNFDEESHSHPEYLDIRNAQSKPQPLATRDTHDGGEGSRPFQRSQQQQAKFDRLNAKDRPKSKHPLPGFRNWILVKTKFGRRFVHDTETRQSLWKIPRDIQAGVDELDQSDRLQREKDENARWAEKQLLQMKQESRADPGVGSAELNESKRSRRRRSESLQREDEEAMMAELAAQEQAAEEEDVKETVHNVDQVMQQRQQQQASYDSDSSYEEVEVTDSEGEEDGELPIVEQPQANDAQDEDPVEFGEDDIAYQLAAMGEDYGLDPAEYGEGDGMQYEEDGEPLGLSEEDAILLFKDMLSDHRVSPFTPWDRIVADQSEASILHDDRYTVLPSMKARREVFDSWVKETAATLKEQRERLEKLDPRIPYLAFLHEKATPKLYWPEFKRRYKREAAMNDRKLQEKDREKLYRDYINRLKLPESTRKADFVNLLKGIPHKDLNNATSADALPQQALSHLHFISVPISTRDQILRSHIRSLPAPPTLEEVALNAEEASEREQRRKRELAMAERQRKVNEDKRQAEIEERKARDRLKEAEREVEAAKSIRGNVKGQL